MGLSKIDKRALEKQSQKNEKLTKEQLLRKTKKLIKQNLLLGNDNCRLQCMSKLMTDMYRSLQGDIFKRRKME